MKNKLPVEITNKEEAIAFLIMLGWELKLPNLLIKPKSFDIQLSIGILDTGYFVFLDRNIESVDIEDSLSIQIPSDNKYLHYSPKTIVSMILDNTNE